jgi:hypothetical protein
MKARLGSIAAVVLAASLIGLPTTGASAVRASAPFQTDARPYLVPLDPSTTFTPIITSGDVIGGGVGGFQFTGTPDGMGAYMSAVNRLEVFVNHELSHRYGDAADSRVSHLTLGTAGGVVGATYLVDGTEGFEYFCSATLDTVKGVPWYFTGEEWHGSHKGGTSIAANAVTGRVFETPQFGRINHENVVPIKGLARSMIYLAEDSFRYDSQAYAFYADSLTKAIEGQGSLTAWVPDDQGDGRPSTNDIRKGDVLTGRFVTVPHPGRYTGPQLNEVTESLGAFRFVRVEDAAHDPGNPGVIYVADTGSNQDQTHNGRLYRFTVDPAHPRQATLEVVLDGDRGDDIVNPDNLGINETTLIIQEDRNRTDSGYARILRYDLGSGTLTPIARLDPSDKAIENGGGPGVWESSGAIDVSDFFGAGSWLVDVQAHDVLVRQQGIDLEIDSAFGERGQLLLMHVAGT